MKRKLEDMKEPNPKRQKKVVLNNWTSATKFSNYMRDDPLIDYLDKIKAPKVYSEELKNVFQFGNSFEERILEQITERGFETYVFPNEINRIMQMSTFYSTLAVLKSNKYDIIFHPVVRHLEQKIWGCPDLIVRGRCLKELFVHVDEPVDDETYYIIDIKCSKLHLTSDKRYMTNSILNKGYKSQIYVYVECLNAMLHTKTPVGFLLGNGYMTTNETSDNPFERPATVHFKEHDLWVEDKMIDAMEWHNLLNDSYKEWSLDPPSVPELYPNMNNPYDTEYRPFKMELAKRIGEITLLWNCGVEHRKNAFRHGIQSYKDERLTASLLGFKEGGKKESIVNALLHASSLFTIPTNNNVYEWRTDTFAFLDIETCYGPDKEMYVYLIGMIYQGEYMTFVMNELTKEEETRVLSELSSYVKNHNIQKILHWGHYERTLLRKRNMDLPLFNMLDIFKCHEYPIVIQGIQRFSIKEVARVLSEHGLLEYKETGVKDGRESMKMAQRMYEEGGKPSKELIEYNKQDCEWMERILELLRVNFK
jgi:uncharacterized protein YprB with RNaseH-like and TPR domain